MNIKKIEAKLQKMSNKKITKIFKLVIPEEELGEIEDDDFRQEVIDMIIEVIKEEDIEFDDIYL